MDLGATVCLPNGGAGLPGAELQAFRQGLTAEMPVTTQQKKRRIEDITVFVISCDGRFALRKRDDKGLLPNLWEFPNTEGRLNAEAAAAYAGPRASRPIEVYELPEARHIFTHLEHERVFYTCRAVRRWASHRSGPPRMKSAAAIRFLPRWYTKRAFCRNPTAGAGKTLGKVKGEVLN